MKTKEGSPLVGKDRLEYVPSHQSRSPDIRIEDIKRAQRQGPIRRQRESQQIHDSTHVPELQNPQAKRAHRWDQGSLCQVPGRPFPFVRL